MVERRRSTTVVRTRSELRPIVLDLLREHERDGALPTSIRFLFYELVQRGIISKHPTGARRPDVNLTEALTDLRKDGTVPWDWIVDETRELANYDGYANYAVGLRVELDRIYLSPWRGDWLGDRRRNPPLVLTESRSLAGVLRGTVSEFSCAISSTNGQTAGHLHNTVGPFLGIGDTVIYLGDYDLAGGHIEENTRRVLETIVGGPLDWSRLAVTRDQIDEHGLPSIVKRDRRYLDGRPHEAVETEALSQTVLVRMLRDRLEELLPEPLSLVQAREARERDAWRSKLRMTDHGDDK